MRGFGLRVATGAVLLFLYLPIVIIALYAFNADRGQSWPITDWTTQWFGIALDNPTLRNALILSLEAASGATIVALVLGTLAGLVVHRFRFFGRETVSLLLVLPIALPGIVTGIALNNVFTSFLGGLTIWTLIIGHGTFCIVVVYNNAIARIRRMGGSVEEASADLGASGWTTFRLVTVPLMRSALVAGAILVFGLSFDEIIVTTFTAGPGITTLPIWIYQNLFRPNQAPIVNVVAAALVVISVIPIYVAQKFSNADERGAGLL